MKARARSDDTFGTYNGCDSGILSAQYPVTKCISSLVSIPSRTYVFINIVPLAIFLYLHLSSHVEMPPKSNKGKGHRKERSECTQAMELVH